ncbi:MAG: hypothetical protein VR66_27345 [Peptococcaceae bacterium BRH_c23]|nr:MAG: hypothetical protein VR66_27345 [Peptococcaceae bacterium BRH_c23]KJS88536.1 MAG: hypothetical protein JL57_12005 [Desulfosporosinus sp. BICA1-9]HBW35138.1 hypothetical protein [Desulfosporosinus sp.]
MFLRAVYPGDSLTIRGETLELTSSTSKNGGYVTTLINPKYKFAGVQAGANTNEILQKLGISKADYDNLKTKDVFG